MPITHAPRPRTRSTVRLVSVVVPLWLTATTSVSLMSRRIPKPLSSVATTGSTSRPPSVSVASVAAMLRPAMAAVPWPITSTRRIAPVARRSAINGGSDRAPTTARNMPSRSMILPRNVLRKLSGASVISLSKKCGAAPRSISRVVTSATTTSRAASGNSVPLYDKRRMPSSSPACAADNANT